MATMEQVEAMIQEGQFWEMCRKCRELIPVSQWTFRNPGSISTIHLCPCGNVETVAHWST